MLVKLPPSSLNGEVVKKYAGIIYHSNAKKTISVPEINDRLKIPPVTLKQTVMPVMSGEIDLFLFFFEYSEKKKTERSLKLSVLIVAVSISPSLGSPSVVKGFVNAGYIAISRRNNEQGPACWVICCSSSQQTRRHLAELIKHQYIASFKGCIINALLGKISVLNKLSFLNKVVNAFFRPPCVRWANRCEGETDALKSKVKFIVEGYRVVFYFNRAIIKPILFAFKSKSTSVEAPDREKNEAGSGLRAIKEKFRRTGFYFWWPHRLQPLTCNFWINLFAAVGFQTSRCQETYCLAGQASGPVPKYVGVRATVLKVEGDFWASDKMNILLPGQRTRIKSCSAFEWPHWAGRGAGDTFISSMAVSASSLKASSRWWRPSKSLVSSWNRSALLNAFTICRARMRSTSIKGPCFTVFWALKELSCRYPQHCCPMGVGLAPLLSTGWAKANTRQASAKQRQVRIMSSRSRDLDLLSSRNSRRNLTLSEINFL